MTTSPPVRNGALLEALGVAVAACRPALLRPGPPAVTSWIQAPDSTGRSKRSRELRVDGDGWRRRGRRSATSPVAAQLGERAPDRVDRHREADALAAAASRVWICALMPSTRAARVEQRAARVAVVDRGVGLDRAGDLEAGQRLDRAVERRDDADRERLLLAERAADRRHRRADLRGRCVEPSGSGRSVRPVGVDLQQRDVGERVEARRSSAGDLVAVGERT